MNQHQHPHDHSHAHHQEKPGRQFHKDWRVWVGVIVMLVALASYILTFDERFRPAPAPAPETAAPSAPVR
jgi:hypothetical protein